jgi:excisionase family DNA binding protein
VTTSDLLTPAQLLERYPQLPSMNTLLRLLNEGQVPARRLGHKWYISASQFEAWMRQPEGAQAAQ